MPKCIKCSSPCNQDNELVLHVRNAPTLLRNYLCDFCCDRWIAAMIEKKGDATYIEKKEAIEE